MTEPAIDLRSLTKRYGVHAAVSEVSLSVPAGCCLALLGHNGAGTTTLMKLMLGLTRASAGALSVLGTDPGSAGLDFRRSIGFLPENVAFHEEISGLETLRFYARLKKEPPDTCAALLDRVGLTHAATRRVKTYSKGMRQRLGLAQALIGRPRLLLLDEPTTGLDPVLRQEFFRIVKDLGAGGATVVLSSHILTELEARTDLIAIMKQGRLTAMGDLDTLRKEADLPIRIVVTASRDAADLAERLQPWVQKRKGEQSLELTCAFPDKMAVLGRITALGSAVADIDIQLPALDDVYLRFGHDPEDVS